MPTAPYNQEAQYARVHRFHNFVAVALVDERKRGETVYLTVEQAKALASVLTEYAKDVEERDFLESKLIGQMVFGEDE